MRGDFSRFGFDPGRSFSRVLIQQGRMTIDADANEQQDLNLKALRTLAADLFGRHGGAGDSFKVSAKDDQLLIAPGHYYVDGWMADNRAPSAYVADEGAAVGGQPFHPTVTDLSKGSYLAYLELWERAVSAAELDPLGLPNSPDALREVALGGPDTAARAQLVWQVKLQPVDQLPKDSAGKPDLSDLDKVIETIWPAQRGTLRAEAAKPPIESDNPCDVPPRSRYRGIENQLYRIEIARGGKTAKNGGDAGFVWSRENGAVAFPIEQVADKEVKLAGAWHDARFAIGVSDIVEITTEASGLGAEPTFHLVTDYDPDTATVTLDSAPDEQSGKRFRPLLLRRWDHGRRRTHGDGSPKMTEDNILLIDEGKQLTIEEGITVTFVPPKAGDNVYRAGDYWLIPGRVVLGDILWPRTSAGPTARPPHGIERHLAPLALIDVGGDGKPAMKKDLRNLLIPLVKPAS